MRHSHKIAAVLSALFAIPMTGSVASKLLQTEQMRTVFEGHGLSGWLIIIGVGELISLLAFLLPRTRVFGSLLLSSYFGGAIMVHMSHSEPFLIPAAFLVYVWLVTWLRGDWRNHAA